jgi:membrane-bound inhibitor of C-type lysozyme
MKKIYPLIIVTILILLGIWAIIPREVPEFLQPEPSNIVNYACREGKTIDAAYYDAVEGEPTQTKKDGTPIPGGSVRLWLSDGRTFNIRQTISASGARYALPDESFVFWAKGNGARVLEDDVEKSYIGCVRIVPQPIGSDLSQIYVSPTGFSLRLPVLSASSTGGIASTTASASTTFSINEAFQYEVSPTKKIAGVKFTIPAVFVYGTNLSKDTSISVEMIPQTASSSVSACTADMFFDRAPAVKVVKENGLTYSMGTLSEAAAGNRYDVTVYSIPGSIPCIAFRYFIHYGVLENYPTGTKKQFDKVALQKLFDSIRSTFVMQ